MLLDQGVVEIDEFLYWLKSEVVEVLGLAELVKEFPEFFILVMADSWDIPHVTVHTDFNSAFWIKNGVFEVLLIVP